MKLVFLKFIRQKSGPFQNLIAGGTRSLVRKKGQEKHLCQPGIFLLHQDHLPANITGAPGRKDVASQDCGSLPCKDSEDKNAELAFL